MKKLTGIVCLLALMLTLTSIILSLRNRLPKEEKKKMLEEATGVSEWIYTVIRKVCAE